MRIIPLLAVLEAAIVLALAIETDADVFVGFMAVGGWVCCAMWSFVALGR